MPNVTFRQLRIFDMVARYQSHTRAAEKLHMTQPAVSMQMKQLEDSLDISLFERQGKSISLTREGRAMRQYSSNIIQSYESMLEYVDEIKGCRQGQLAISVTTTANYFTSRILAAFSKQFPQINISLDVTNRQKILAQLEHNEPNLVIMGEPPKGHELMSEKFMVNPLVIIAPADHPLVDRKQLDLDTVLKEKFVVREPGSGTREAIERHFRKFNKSCTSGLEMSSNEAIKHAVAAGFGLGVVSKHTIDLEIANNYLKILDVKEFPIERHWHLVSRQGKPMSPIATAFREFLLQQTSKPDRLNTIINLRQAN